ncbi:MAG: glycosyltransferase family 4 protein [Pseudomonadota bacterium]
MQIDIVVQRYGPECVGGAESHAQQLAEALSETPDWSISVLTTAAKRYETWANEYPVGQESINGIDVWRHAIKYPRHPRFDYVNDLAARYFPTLWARRFGPVTRMLESLWLKMQGPYSPDLVKRIGERASTTDLFIFFTYLYHPTIRGLPQVRNKAILIPTAHDEPPFYFQMTQSLLSSTRAIIANSPAEARLLERRLPGVKERTVVGAVGLPATLKARSEDGDYLLYLGRIGFAKSTDELIRFVYQINNSADKPIRLVLAGSNHGMEIPTIDCIEYRGFVSEEEKACLIHGCRAVVNPSRYESLSLIVLEALSAGKPAIVSTHCEVLRDYCVTLPTVFGYHDQASFGEALTMLTRFESSPDRKANLDFTSEWVENHFSWQQVRNNIQKCCERLSDEVSVR